MVKNTKGGKHHKKQKKRRDPQQEGGGQLVYAEEGQVYGSILKKVGGSRILVTCSDTKDRSGIIPGKFFKRVWLNIGDIVLCGLDENDDSQCYIIHKYSYKDSNLLKSQGKITFNINEEGNDDENGGYGFEDDEYDEVNEKKAGVLDIKNVKGKSKKKDVLDDSDNDSDDDLEANTNRSNSLQSSKWSKDKKEKEEEDTKEYTIDDL